MRESEKNTQAAALLMMDKKLPELYTCLSPALLDLYDVSNSTVVIIDILRATSTITMALHNGAKCIIPVASVAECIRIGKQIDAITAGERDGQVAEGLQYGNSPFEYPDTFIASKTLVLTTTNGTRLLHMALEKGAREIVIGSFCNLDTLCDYLVSEGRPVLLACAAWKDKVNIEDSLFSGAVVQRVKNHFQINCDASQMAEALYREAASDMFAFMKEKNASHYKRLTSYGLEDDIRFCLNPNTANILPIYLDGKLVKKSSPQIHR